MTHWKWLTQIWVEKEHLKKKSAAQYKLFQNRQLSTFPTSHKTMLLLCCLCSQNTQWSPWCPDLMSWSWPPGEVLCPLHSILVFALTVQPWEDAFGDHSCPDNIWPREATGCGEHGDVIHKLLMEAPSFIAELGPWEVTAEPLHTSLSLSQKDTHKEGHTAFVLQVARSCNTKG